jgi:membrane dipeptidase
VLPAGAAVQTFFARYRTPLPSRAFVRQKNHVLRQRPRDRGPGSAAVGLRAIAPLMIRIKVVVRAATACPLQLRLGCCKIAPLPSSVADPAFLPESHRRLATAGGGNADPVSPRNCFKSFGWFMTPADECVIDGLQYCNWSQKVFDQMRASGVVAVHATISYHENFRETVGTLIAWNRRFDMFADRIIPGRTADDIHGARAKGRTAIFLGSQNPASIEDDIGLVEILHRLGLRFMQLSYNNQSLLAAGCYETEDAGITRMGKQVIAEMNRVGMVVDMSHSGETSTLQAIELSKRPIAISHANPFEWAPVVRNKSERVLRALGQSGGMLGFSLYPLHLRAETACKLEDFCAMVARTAERIGVERIGIGSDLCQDQPDSVVGWMRNGRWSKAPQSSIGFKTPPHWFCDNTGFVNLREGLRAIGFAPVDVERILYRNWLDFFTASFSPAEAIP